MNVLTVIKLSLKKNVLSLIFECPNKKYSRTYALFVDVLGVDCAFLEKNVLTMLELLWKY